MAADSSLASGDCKARLGSQSVLRKGQLERNYLRTGSPAEFSLLSSLDAAG